MTKKILKKFVCDCGKEVYRPLSCIKPCPVCGAKMEMKKMRNNHIWKPEEDKILRANYRQKLYWQIAEEMGMTERQITNRIKNLGLRLPKKEFMEHQAHGRFNKDSISWNKGLRGRHFTNSGQFSKGNLPGNTLYDGAITTRTDKSGLPYKWIRLSKAKWIELHRFNWEKKHGKVKKGFCIWFKDGNSLNPDIKNLELITRAEDLKRNRPKDLYTNTHKYRIDSDKYIAGLFVGKNKKKRAAFAERFPELIKLKRAELQLQEELRYAS
jgi:hypothetical protein